MRTENPGLRSKNKMAYKGRGLYGQLTISDWLNDKKRVPLKGISFKNMEYAADLERASNLLGRTSTVTYFCIIRLDTSDYERKNFRTMMSSAVRQRRLCYAAEKDLERYEVAPKYDRVFQREIKNIFSRSEHIYLIVQENLKLTRYWPYIEAVGFERLLDFEQHYTEDKSSVLDVLLPEITAWMSEHAEEVESYMVKIQPEIDRKKAFLERKKETIKAEKEAAKAARKAEREEIKMLKEQAHKNAVRRRKIQRELDATIRRADV